MTSREHKTSIIPFKSLKRVSVLLPYGPDANENRKTVWDAFRSHGIDADVYFVASKSVRGFALVSSTILFDGSKQAKENSARFATWQSDMLLNLCESGRALELALVSPARCKVGVNTDETVYDFIQNGEGSVVALFENLFTIIQSFE